MDITLVVVRPFGPHAVGETITVPADIAAVLACEHAHNVVAVSAPSKQSET